MIGKAVDDTVPNPVEGNKPIEPALPVGVLVVAFEGNGALLVEAVTIVPVPIRVLVGAPIKVVLPIENWVDRPGRGRMVTLPGDVPVGPAIKLEFVVGYGTEARFVDAGWSDENSD